jgi:regulator of sigma E protease
MTGILLVWLALWLVLFANSLGQFAGFHIFGVSGGHLHTGFGPELASLKTRGGTLDARAFPALVWFSIEGKPGETSHKAAAILSGPLANMLLAFALFFSVLVFWGLPGRPPVLENVVPGSPAEQAGFKPGDTILSLNGKPVPSWDMIDDTTRDSMGAPLAFTALRAGQTCEIRLTPALQSTFTKGELEDDRYAGGFVFLKVMNQKLSVPGALVQAGKEMLHVTEIAGASLWFLAGGSPGKDTFKGASRFLGDKGAFADSLFAAWLFALAALSHLAALLGAVPLPRLNPFSGTRLFLMLCQSALKKTPGPRAVAITGWGGVTVLALLAARALAATFF